MKTLRLLGMLIVASLIGVLLTPVPATAAAWHGTVVQHDFVDITRTADRPIRGTFNTVREPVPFPLTVLGTTSRYLTLDTHGFVTVGNGASVGGAVLPQYLSGWMQVTGSAPSRQVIVQVQAGTTERPFRSMEYEFTFFEGRPGVLATYKTAPTGVFGAGLNNGASFPAGAGATIDRPVTLTDGLSLWYGVDDGAGLPATLASDSDSQGYRAIPVPYRWVDVENALSIRYDEALHLPFDVRLYGFATRDLRVGNSGVVSFSGLPPGAAPRSLPDGGGDGMLYAALESTAMIYDVEAQLLGAAPHRQVVLRFWGYCCFNASLGQKFSDHQVVLFEDSPDILVQHRFVGTTPTVVGISKSYRTGLRPLDAATDASAVLFTRGSAAASPAPLQGAPLVDRKGYRAVDSDDPGGPAYDWVDMADGLDVTVAQYAAAQVDLPFPVDLYGFRSQHVQITDQGVLGLDPSITYTRGGYGVPSGERPFGIAAFFGNLRDCHEIVKTTGASPRRVVAIAWEGCTGQQGTVAMQILLQERSTDVVVQYKTITGSIPYTYDAVGLSGGSAMYGGYCCRTSGGFRYGDYFGHGPRDGLALRYTTDHLLSVEVPTLVRRDGAPVTISNNLVNPTLDPLPEGHVEVAFDTTDAEHLHLRYASGTGWTEAPLTPSAGARVVASLPTASLGVGADASRGLRLTVDKGASLGRLLGDVSLVTSDGAVLARVPFDSEVTATVPDAVKDPHAEPRDAGAVVSWSAASDGGVPLTGYRVTVEGQVLDLPPTSSSAVIEGLINATSYDVTVEALNALGASSPARTTVTAGAPSAPTNVVAQPADRGAVVSWSAAAANGSAVLDYTVTAVPGGQSRTVQGTSIRLAGLTNGASVAFVVTARNAFGSSTPSDASSAVTPLPLPVLRSRLSAPAVRRGTVVRLSGTAVPLPLGSLVDVQQRDAAGVWRTVARVAVVRQQQPKGVVTVGFDRTLRPAVPGTYAYRAVWQGSASYLPATGAVLSLRVS